MIQQNKHLASDFPIFTHLPPTTLQYADDILIITRASPEAATHLKSIFSDFAVATGLNLNFSKTTFVSINTMPDFAREIANILHCPTSALPQIYLGLPLSPIRLPPTLFSPSLNVAENSSLDGVPYCYQKEIA